MKGFGRRNKKSFSQQTKQEASAANKGVGLLRRLQGAEGVWVGERRVRGCWEQQHRPAHPGYTRFTIIIYRKWRIEFDGEKLNTNEKRLRVALDYGDSVQEQRGLQLTSMFLLKPPEQKRSAAPQMQVALYLQE